MAKNNRQLVTSDEAVKAKRQHKKPCSDCPWSRSALPGWLGGVQATEWVRTAHSDDIVDCHTRSGAQCAGMATYRSNVCKLPRSDALVLPANREKVFATPMQFMEHHKSKGTKE